MAKIILKWRYLKGNSSKHAKHLVNYIATREGVEASDESWKYMKATIEQQKLVDELVRDFPHSIESFEYQEYITNMTKGTASQFIDRTIEDNLDIIGKKENYVSYIAKRPHVEKLGAHGLFSQTDEPINLSKVAKTVAEHKGAVWTTIISLKREDAIRLGFDNAKAWRDMLRAESCDLAKRMNIPLADLRWYAAFHNEGGHPHVHLISYSVGKEPYMSEAGLMKLKSDLAHEIFKQDFYQIYDKQTQVRDELRMEGKKTAQEIVAKIKSHEYKNETIELMLRELAKELDGYTGKKVYGYLPKRAKNLVNGIVEELSKDEKLSQLYNLWYEQKENLLKIYQNNLPSRIPLSSNKEFKTIRNDIVKEAFQLIGSSIFIDDSDDQKDLRYFNPDEESDELSAFENDSQFNVPLINTDLINKSYSVVSKKYMSDLSLALSSLRLATRLSQLIEKDIKEEKDTSNHIDRKLRIKMAEKRMAQGQKMG